MRATYQKTRLLHHKRLTLTTRDLKTSKLLYIFIRISKLCLLNGTNGFHKQFWVANISKVIKERERRHRYFISYLFDFFQLNGSVNTINNKISFSKNSSNPSVQTFSDTETVDKNNKTEQNFSFNQQDRIQGSEALNLRSSMSSVQSANAGHLHQNSSAHVARSGHLDAAAVLAHGSPQRQIGRCS